MSKLSDGLKALINAAYARPGTVKAPANIKSIYQRIADSASEHKVGVPAWLTISTAATMTMNSPSSLLQLHALASQQPSITPVQAAELIREVGLKCISFNGIPRTINCLGAFKDGLPQEVQSQLSDTPTRQVSNANADDIVARGRTLWDSIYRPFENKLFDKLAQSHPNLPVHILSAHYGTLLSNPDPNVPASVGRVLTSLVAISCLRAQTGVGPQVISHVFGLRKAFEDGTAEEDVEGGRWLASDEGTRWILETVDSIVEAIGAGQTTFAPGFIRAKL
ncbi:hypothetical protein DV738_g3200, partial [Chaetothyriales sp. CBS 135597]